MAGTWNLGEARLVQFRTGGSAANADDVDFSGSPVPAGKCWIILAFSYAPSVAETQTISFSKVCANGTILGLLNPVSLALNPAKATFIEQGMEYLLLPGEYIRVLRGTHTAGSSMYVDMQFVEIDLPLYTYDEPQRVKRQQMALSSIRQMLGGGTARGPVGPTLTSERGGRSGPLEK